MRVAYLIQAHHQPGHLGRLIRALQDDGATAFVHIDAKFDASPFRRAVEAAVGEIDDRVVFLPDSQRVVVHWAHVSQVAATLNLIEAASRAPGQFDRYVLLSGADYPIKSPERILETLSHPEAEYIRIWNPLTPECREYGFVSTRHLMQFPFANPRSPDFKRFDQKVARGLWRRLQAMLPERKPKLGDIALFQGSQWWALTHACVQYIRDYHAMHPEYYRFFQLTAGSDEIFFHSLVASSQFAANVRPDPVHGRSDDVPHGVHFLDWSGRERGIWSPRDLDENDLPRLDASEAIFARKFDETVSAGLLDLLDARR